MCLKGLLETGSETVTAYKVFAVVNEKLMPPFRLSQCRAFDKGFSYKENEWIECEKHEYFYAFKKESDAYALIEEKEGGVPWSMRGNNYVVREVTLRGKISVGLHEGLTYYNSTDKMGYTAKEIFVKSKETINGK